MPQRSFEYLSFRVWWENCGAGFPLLLGMTDADSIHGLLLKTAVRIGPIHR